MTVGAGEGESSTEESTTEESTTVLEESTTEESTTDIIVTEPTTESDTNTIVQQEDFSLLEPTSYESEQENLDGNNPSYIYIILLATAGILTVVIGTVLFFVAKGYRGKNKKQKIVVEEKYRGK